MHKSVKTVANLHELALSDFLLSSDRKRILAWKKFSDNKAAETETEAYFEEKDKSYY